MMKLKKWDWLVPVLILAILLPACPQAPVAPASQVEAYEPYYPQDIPRYEHKIYPGEFDEEKVGINYLPDFRYAVSVDNELLDARSERLDNGNYTMLDGTLVNPGTVFYLIPGAVLAKNGEEIEDVRITDFYRNTWQRNGPSFPYLTVSEPDVYDGVVKYKKDKPDKPVVENCHHNGNIISSIFGALRRVGSVLINWWIKKNTLDAIACYSFNHTVGLAGWGGFPGWCINGPWKSNDKAGDALGYQGALEFQIDPGVVKYQYGATIEIHYKKKPVEAKHITGIIAMDSDGDHIPDDWEINHGTNPDDPNDPGNPTTLAEVPCMPNGAHWDLTDAENALIDADLAVGDVLHEPSSLPAGCFIRFMPVCGSQISRGTQVDIVISSGPIDNTVEIPCYVIGDPYNAYDDELRDRLLAAGFLAANIHRHVNYCPSGQDVGDVNAWHAADCWQTYKWSWQCGDRAVPATTQLHYWVRGCVNPHDYIGLNGQVVKNELEGLGFTVLLQEQVSTAVDPGEVFSVTINDCDATVCVAKQQNNALVVTITSPADNFVGTVGQVISFTCTVTGGVGSYDNFKWHFADNSFKYQQNVTKTFDFPGAGWCYIDVTDHAGTVAQDKVWVQINAPAKSAYRGPIFWMGQTYEFGSWPAEAKTFLGL